MKKFLALLLCILMAFCVVACDKDEDKDTSDDGDKGNSDKQQTVSFYVEYGSAKIELGADAASIISALGEPASKQEMGSCGDQGTLTKYKYSSIEIYVLTNGSKQTIDQITLIDDGVKTPEGVKIGSSKDDVTKTCGKATKQSDTNITYSSGNKNLVFQLRDGSVVGIDYRMKTT